MATELIVSLLKTSDFCPARTTSTRAFDSFATGLDWNASAILLLLFPLFAESQKSSFVAPISKRCCSQASKAAPCSASKFPVVFPSLEVTFLVKQCCVRSLCRWIEPGIHPDFKTSEEPTAGIAQEIIAFVVRWNFGEANNGGRQFIIEIGLVVGIIFLLQLALEFGERRLLGEWDVCVGASEIRQNDDGNNAELAEEIRR
jgi:hypothetical protein